MTARRQILSVLDQEIALEFNTSLKTNIDSHENKTRQLKITKGILLTSYNIKRFMEIIAIEVGNVGKSLIVNYLNSNYHLGKLELNYKKFREDMIGHEIIQNYNKLKE